MDLTVLDKSSKMTPLLVKLYDSHKLHKLARDKKPQARAELTSAVSELLEMELTQRESELLADVLIELMQQAERDIRQALAERLSVMDNAPLRLILKLANDEISVADSILCKSDILSDVDLIYIIKGKGAEHWRAIAKRPKMSDQLIDALVDTGEKGTVTTLVQNNEIRLTGHAVDVVSYMAFEDEGLAKSLLQRDEVSLDVAQRLYQKVGDALKEYIMDAYDIENSISVEAVVDEVVTELVDAADENTNFMPSNSLIRAARRYKEKELLTIKLMLGSLRRGQIAAFIAQFSQFTGMRVETVIDILKQDSGQGLAVIGRAFDIEKPDFLSILMLTQPMRNSERKVDVEDISKAVGYYKKIDKRIAEGIIRNSVDGAS